MDLKQFAKALESVDIPALNKRIAGNECHFLESEINRFTPVDTGNLKSRNNVIPEADGSITIENDTEYASDVEYGHRLKNGGLVAGQFFVRKGIDAWQRGFSERYINELKKEMKLKGIG